MSVPSNYFVRIHTSSLINIEKVLNRPITKFYNSDDANVIDRITAKNEANFSL